MPPTGASAVIGASASLSVTVAGESPVTFEWWNEFGPLFPPRTNATLAFPSVERFDAGTYRVVVRNAFGAVTSAPVGLTVNAPATGTNVENIFWARRNGGGGADLGANVAVDQAGNTYVVGTFTATATLGTNALVSAGGSDIFVAKYDPAGSLVWAKRAGGVMHDFGIGVATDRSGNVHITGSFSDAANFNGTILRSRGVADAFVASYDREGSLLWARSAGGAGSDAGRHIAADAAGNTYVLGNFSGTATFQSVALTSHGGDDVFLAKYSASGVLLWARRAGGGGADAGTGLALDPAAQPIVTGRFRGAADFGPGVTLSGGSADEAFIAKFDRAGTALWAQKVTGIDTVGGASVAADSDGSCYLLGAFVTTANFGATNLAPRGARDLFTAKYDGTGRLLWATRAGGVRGDGIGFGVERDELTRANSFLSGAISFHGGMGGTNVEVFVGKFGSDGQLLWGKRAGTSPTEFACGISIDDAGTRRLIGYLESAGDAGFVSQTLLVAPLAEPTGVGLPPSITTHPQSQSVTTSTVVTFVANASGEGTLNYQWRFNGADIPGATSNSFAIDSVRATNGGRYQVIVFNANGATASDVAVLEVQAPAQPDAIPPTVTFSVPAASRRVTNAVFAIQGNAADNVALARVECQLGAGPWQTARGTTNWTDTINLSPGTNVVRARSIDLAGNVSRVISQSVLYVAMAPLVVQVRGGGSVAPNLNGQLLEIGRAYKLTATPAAGQLFAGWSGGVEEDALALGFTMRSNLVLQANFVSNLFLSLKGSYQGLFYETDEVRHGSSGFILLTLTDHGVHAGSLQSGGRRLAWRGQFELDGRSTNQIVRTGTNALTLELVCAVADGFRITGRVTDGSWISPLLLERSAFHATTNRAPFAGKYTLWIPGATNDPSRPSGDGFGTVSVDPAGAVTFAGTLADDTPVTQRVVASRDGQWPLYASLYGGRGSILSWITFTNRTHDDLAGLLSWIKPPQPNQPVYPTGFATEAAVIGSEYTPPATRTNRVIALTNGVLAFADGNLRSNFSNRVTLTPDNKVSNLSSNKVTLTLTPASGLFSGRVIDPTTGKQVPFKGAVSQKRNAGAGFFHGTNQIGRVTLDAR